MAGDIFIKHNSSAYKDQLYCEAKGLSLLSSASNPELIKIPFVDFVDEKSIGMQKIESCRFSEALFEKLGKGLAFIHSQKQNQYGFESDNYIGLNPQKNGFSQNWGEFFLEQRLGHQISLIADKDIQQRFRKVLENKYEELESFLNRHCEFPSLLHGDLWSGNALADENNAWLIDPAVYFGDREADLAMTEMFGGFSATFYRAYDNTLPRSKVYEQKRIIYNLYHYLNHYNLFAGGYLRSCQSLFHQIENNTW